MKILTMNDNENGDKNNFIYTTEAANIFKDYVLNIVLVVSNA